MPAFCVARNSPVSRALCCTKVPERGQYNAGGAKLPYAEAISLKPYRSRRVVPDVATLVVFKHGSSPYRVLECAIP